MEKISDTFLENKSSFLLDSIIFLDGKCERHNTPSKGQKEHLIVSEHKFLIEISLKDYIILSFDFMPNEAPKSKAKTIFRFCDFEIPHFTWNLIRHDLIIKIFDKQICFHWKVALMDWNKITLIHNKKLNEATLFINDFKQIFAVENINLSKNKFFLGIFGNKDTTSSYKGFIKNFRIHTYSELSLDMLDEIKNNHLASKKDNFNFNEPMSNPIRTLRELDLWMPSDKYYNYSRKKGKSKLCICHDMMGGYAEDRWPFGIKTNDYTYRFHHWSFTDIFIYFSHERVTIPPPNYINICHSFGTKCLGVLITEWEEGEKENILLIKGDVKNEDGKIINKGKNYYADRLCEICKYYQFDGYLINIEAKVNNVQGMLDWLSYLTKKLHEVVPGGIIMYYDSIINNGQLKSQSQLNENNKIFFDSADLFFADYRWNENMIKQSSEFAGNKRNDIFTGIDIWGRDTYGGGNFNTHLAIDKCLEFNTSIAIFGQA